MTESFRKPGLSASSFSKRLHPACALFYFASVALLVMVSIEPVLVALSLASSFAFSCYLRGCRATFAALRWQLPLFAVVTLVNPLFGDFGTTVLANIAGHDFTAESLLYGACLGALLVATLIWFSNASVILDFGRLSACFGSTFPNISLVISMVMRLVTRNLSRAEDIRAAMRVPRLDNASAKRDELRQGARIASVLMGWSLEDSLERADSMRSRGWTRNMHRTTYLRFRMRALDVVVLVVVLALDLVAGIAALTLVGGYAFYPLPSALGAWWLYLPFCALAFSGLACSLLDDFVWRRAERSRAENGKEAFLWVE